MTQVSPVADQIAAIRDLDREALVARWRAIYGEPPPKGVSRRLLERAAAHAVQARAFGGLKPKTKRMLRRFADADTPDTTANSPKPDLAPGTRLLREWNGRTHEVEVTGDGFLWNGETYPSLSAVARAITGARWSGPRFFGL